MRFDGPIPGQSLTGTPRNAPWERPPETADPDEAITHHLTRLSQPEVMNHVLDGVSGGLPVSMITDLMLTGAVAKGIHSIDISMMIAPIIHDYIVNLLRSEEVEFKEFFDKEEKGDSEGLAISMAISNISDNPRVEELQEEPEVEVVEEKPKGLMARRNLE